jgi:pantothenate kinase type III
MILVVDVGNTRIKSCFEGISFATFCFVDEESEKILKIF